MKRYRAALIIAILVILAAAPAQATTYDFSWQTSDILSSGSLTSTQSGQGTATIEPGPQIGNTPTTILRFTAPASGPFDGLWGGQLMRSGDSYNGSVTYPSTLTDRGLSGFTLLTMSDGGFTLSGTHWPSGPDHIFGSIKGVGTVRTVATPEPVSLLLLSLAGFATAAFLKHKDRRRK
jgi:hypothetical protein